MSNPAEKLHVIIRQYDSAGCDSVVCEYETLTLAKLLEHIYAFSIGRHDNAVRMTVDIAYPNQVNVMMPTDGAEMMKRRDSD